jgi:hypothetical protein
VADKVTVLFDCQSLVQYATHALFISPNPRNARYVIQSADVIVGALIQKQTLLYAFDVLKKVILGHVEIAVDIESCLNAKVPKGPYASSVPH